MPTVRAELDRLAAIAAKAGPEPAGSAAIARELAAAGVTGTPHSQSGCPLAVHLRRTTGAADVRVTRYRVTHPGGEVDLARSPGDLLAVRAFVCAFDDTTRFRALR